MKAIVSISTGEVHITFYSVPASLVWTTWWVLFSLEHTSAAKQAAKRRTQSMGDSQMIFALPLCFGELLRFVIFVFVRGGLGILFVIAVARVFVCGSFECVRQIT